MSGIVATYRIQCAPDDVDRIARWIAIEQTVEVPEALVDEAIIGKVRTIEPAPGRPSENSANAFDIAMEFREDLAAGHLPQLVNLVYGNVSLRHGVRLIGLELPDSLLARFAGPRFGVAGLRELIDVRDRPLLATVLKPRGLSATEFARIAGEFAEGGGDLVKDDHNLVGPGPEEFEARVQRCQEAVTAANVRNGRRCLYVPFLHAPAEELDRQAAFCVGQGVRGVMVAPMVLGLDTVRALGRKHGLFLLGHPTLTGGLVGPEHGIARGLLYGTLARLAGIDISVFVNAGGRFAWTPAQCRDIADHLRAPLGALKAAWPCPAGGMTFDHLEPMIREFGPDTVLLVGGALLTAEPTVREGTRKYQAEITRVLDR